MSYPFRQRPQQQQASSNFNCWHRHGISIFLVLWLYYCIPYIGEGMGFLLYLCVLICIHTYIFPISVAYRVLQPIYYPNHFHHHFDKPSRSGPLPNTHRYQKPTISRFLESLSWGQTLTRGCRKSTLFSTIGRDSDFPQTSTDSLYVDVSAIPTLEDLLNNQLTEDLTPGKDGGVLKLTIYKPDPPITVTTKIASKNESRSDTNRNKDSEEVEDILEDIVVDLKDPNVKDFDIFLRWNLYDAMIVASAAKARTSGGTAAITPTLLHSTEKMRLKVFDFSLARAQDEVFPSWEWITRSMIKGEEAWVYLRSDYAFGSEGTSTIPPNTNLIAKFQLKNVLPTITFLDDIQKKLIELAKQENGSIDDETDFDSDDTDDDEEEDEENESEETIHTEDNHDTITVDSEPIDTFDIESRTVSTMKERSVDDIIDSIDVDTLEVQPTEEEKREWEEYHNRTSSFTTPKSTSTITSPALNSQTTPVESVSPTTNSSQQARPPRYVNPKRDKLDPNRRVLGNSFDHRWVEKTDTIDIDVRLPKGVKNKNQLNVVVKATSINLNVKGEDRPFFSGNLFGKIKPSATTWAVEFETTSILDATRNPESDVVRSEEERLCENGYIRLFFEKAHGYQDIWGSVLDAPDVKVLHDRTVFTW